MFGYLMVASTAGLERCLRLSGLRILRQSWPMVASIVELERQLSELRIRRRYYPMVASIAELRPKPMSHELQYRWSSCSALGNRSLLPNANEIHLHQRRRWLLIQPKRISAKFNQTVLFTFSQSKQMISVYSPFFEFLEHFTWLCHWSRCFRMIGSVMSTIFYTKNLAECIQCGTGPKSIYNRRSW